MASDLEVLTALLVKAGMGVGAQYRLDLEEVRKICSQQRIVLTTHGEDVYINLMPR